MHVNPKEGNTTSDVVLPMEFTFNSNNKKIRSFIQENQPWFVAKDVCEILDIQNTSNSVKALDEDERAMRNIGRQGDAWLINESGLYNLIFRSNKPEAKAFRKWVTNEVLPSIRKSGEWRAKGGERSPLASPAIDVRDIPYSFYTLGAASVRHIMVEDIDYFSMNDIFKAIKCSTESTQSARMLNKRRIMAKKLHVFGNTHPA